MEILKNIKRGDIWFVELDPTLSHEINKTRPAVIIQNDIGNVKSGTTIIAPITSQKTERIFPVEVLISGLPKSSKVMLDQIRTVDKSRLVKLISKVDEETMLKIDEAIRISLDV